MSRYKAIAEFSGMYVLIAENSINCICATSEFMSLNSRMLTLQFMLKQLYYLHNNKK